MGGSDGSGGEGYRIITKLGVFGARMEERSGFGKGVLKEAEYGEQKSISLIILHTVLIQHQRVIYDLQLSRKSLFRLSINKTRRAIERDTRLYPSRHKCHLFVQFLLK